LLAVLRLGGVQEEEEETMGDVDLFTLSPDGEALTVNAKWLQHLQERLLGEDGHPVKVKPGEDPHSMGLVLEWVYGSIVSTAEKVGHSGRVTAACPAVYMKQCGGSNDAAVQRGGLQDALWSCYS
jgi:hypothetical protein